MKNLSFNEEVDELSSLSGAFYIKKYLKYSSSFHLYFSLLSVL